MAANNDVQLAKQTIQSLTSLMNITQIIYVDDYFEARFDVEIIIGWLYNVPENRFAEMAELLPGVNLSSPSEIWTRELRNIWERLTIDAQKETAVNISASSLSERTAL